MRPVLCLLVLAWASAAGAQSLGADRADSTDVLVLSVVEEGGGYVYDLDGRDETEAYLYSSAGVFVARAPGVGMAVVLLEPANGQPGPSVATVLTPDDPADVIDQYVLDDGYGADTPSGYPEYRVTVLVCTQGSGSDCDRWVTAAPKSGGTGLVVVIVPGPELGPGEPDPPVDPFDPD